MKINVNDKVMKISITNKDIENKKVMNDLSKLMDVIHQSQLDEAKEIQAQFDISELCASNILYLRTRSRWTQEDENELIRMDKEDNYQPNIFEWP